MSALDRISGLFGRGSRSARTLATGLSAALVVAAFGFADAHAAGPDAVPYHFFTFDNKADGNFNQLLGVNQSVEIVGYDGDGTVQPNKGYLLVPGGHYSDENFPGSVQTQVIGINNNPFPLTVGFWVDGTGNNFGFVNNHFGGFASVHNPHTGVSGGVKVNQLLGVNDAGIAAGFYVDSAGNSHGYTFNSNNNTFSEIKLPFANVKSFQATGINNANIICGAYTDAVTTHGFFGKKGSFTTVSVPHTQATTFFGENNKGVLVGFVTKGGVSEGLIYDSIHRASRILNDPHQSAKTAFGVNGTTINGINDLNQIVGFYSDGKKVHGFYAFP